MLDDIERVRSIDKRDMLGTISRLPSLIESGYQSVTKLKIRMGHEVRGIHFLGLGGSAIGGDVLCDWLGNSMSCGFIVERGYHLTTPIAEDQLVVCCSYSGNTLETRYMLDEVLRDRSEGVLLITSGGVLAEVSRKKNLPALALEPGIPPRASLPSVMSAMAALCDRIGLTKGALDELLSARSGCEKFIQTSLAPEVSTKDNLAKQLAHRIHELIPVVIAPFTMVSVARRWKTQMNENAKQHCHFSSFPEVTHNEIIPWLRDTRSSMLTALILRDSIEHPQLTKDLDRFRDIIGGQARMIEIRSSGSTRIEQLLNHILMADFASTYSAILSGADPSPVNEIDLFKEDRC